MRVKSAHPSPSRCASRLAAGPPLPNEATPLGLADLARALTVLHVPADLAELAKSLEVAS